MPPKRSAPASASNGRSKKAKPTDDGPDPTAPPRRAHRWSKVSGSANTDDDYRLAARNTERSRAYITICPPPFARGWDKEDDSEDDDEDEDEDSEDKDDGCDGGKTCLCSKPAAEHPEHKWVISYAGFRKYIAQQIMAQLRCPDNFGMYTFNDHDAYGILEMVENLLLDFDEAKDDWREQWAVCEGAAFFLNDSASDPMTMADDGDRVDALAHLVGRMILTMLARLQTEGVLAEASEVKNLGLVMALLIDWAIDSRQYGLLEDDEPDTFAAKTKKGRPVISRFDDYVLAYADRFGIPLTGPKNLDELLSQCDRDVELPAAAGADVWGWAKALKLYEKEHGGGHPAGHRGGHKTRIGGDSLDITTWTSSERKSSSFDKKDPLGKKEIEALKKGLIMHLG